MSNISDSSGGPSVHRRRVACMNCRTKCDYQKCDSSRPTCTQCRLRPPRAWAPCAYPDVISPERQQTPAEMLETIRTLTERVEELELVLPSDPSKIYLNHPYLTPVSSGTPDPADLDTPSIPEATHFFGLPEPPPNTIVCLVDTFTNNFSGDALFFLDLTAFRRAQYTPDTFLLCCLQNLGQGLDEITARPKLALEVIQAELLLSLYYMHAAQPIQGRYHISAAVTIALGARFHLIGSRGNTATHSPQFPLRALWALDATEEGVSINALWAVVILNNYWVAVDGGASCIHGVTIETPWPLSSRAPSGTTIMRFLDGDDSNGHSDGALLSKASILLEQAFGIRLRWPGWMYDWIDSAIIRLHAAYTTTSNLSRAKCLAAAARITSMFGENELINRCDPVLGAVSTTVCSLYVHEMATIYGRWSGGDLGAQLEYYALDAKFNEVIRAMRALAQSSPMMGKNPT
ncbi:hypothetical protein B0H17DRAFT_1149481 [Mycena rosella]|uniref:Zn(2)-C6 fungal-type domain-containing protein n=1 Tax=Mycena rosella TaxID=1033263 RepID=A0AAD7FTP3_MYCRO|nr:hypothetical protein B0H17DRAFT_1149481 [Mycena rosella]